MINKQFNNNSFSRLGLTNHILPHPKIDTVEFLQMLLYSL